MPAANHSLALGPEYLVKQPALVSVPRVLRKSMGNVLESKLHSQIILASDSLSFFSSCAEVSTSVCPFITCADNPKYRCQRKIVNHKLVCACPSCDAAPDKPWCLMTKLVHNIKILFLAIYYLLSVNYCTGVWSRRIVQNACMMEMPRSVAARDVLTSLTETSVSPHSLALEAATARPSATGHQKMEAVTVVFLAHVLSLKYLTGAPALVCVQTLPVLKDVFLTLPLANVTVPKEPKISTESVLESK